MSESTYIVYILIRVTCAGAHEVIFYGMIDKWFFMGKRVGFTAKTSEHTPGMYINIPRKTVESKDLSPGEKVEAQLRNMQSKSIMTEASISGTKDQLKFYIGKETVEELGLEDKELVDVFLQ